MGLFRGCLVMLGLIALLLVTSCVLGVTGMRKVANPTRFSFTATETPEKTRRMLGDYLEVAANESAADIGLTRPATIEVQDFTDGSIHLTLDQGSARLMEVVAKITPVDETATRVEIFSNADPLAEALRPRVQPSALHREIRRDLGAAIEAISDQRVLGGGLLVSRLVAEARGGRRKRRMYP